MRTWVRLYTELPDDPKMGRLSDLQFRTAVNLFALAGRIDQDGLLPSLGDMAWTLRFAETDLLEILAELAAVGIVDERDDGWYCSNFAKRNPVALSAEPEAVRERVSRYRGRQRTAPEKCNEGVTSLHAGCNEGVTSLHANGNGDVTTLEGEIDREEIKRERETETTAAPPADAGPTPTTPKRERAKKLVDESEAKRIANRNFEIARALATVCGMDVAINAARLVKAAREMLEAHPPPTPDLIAQQYGPGSWWYLVDWRGQRDELPKPATIRETWGQWLRPAAKARPNRANGTGPPDELSPGLQAIEIVRARRAEQEANSGHQG